MVSIRKASQAVLAELTHISPFCKLTISFICFGVDEITPYDQPFFILAINEHCIT